MNTTHKIILSAAAVATLAPMLALAQVNATVKTNAAADVAAPGVHATLIASTTVETTRAARAKEKGDQEIDRRIKSLTALSARVDEMKKISVEIKASIKSNIQNQINDLTALKAKIDVDTELATLKTDIQSVTKSYRIYMLIMPEARITAAADRIAIVINMMAQLGAKLQARVNAQKQGGTDTTALDDSLKDLVAKLTSAQTHTQSSITLIAPLTPDQGDKTVQASNETAIKNAQGEIKAAVADLAAARKDIAAIISGLGKLNASANSNASTTVKTPAQ